jgi:cytidine deaminase
MHALIEADSLISQELKSLLNKARAPVTRRKVAAIIEFDSGLRSSGFNIESEGGILHAETQALQDAKGSIKRIHLMANGGPMDIKKAFPCEACAKNLENRLSKGAIAEFYFNDGSGKVVLDLQAICQSYTAFDNDAITELKETHLTPTDKRLVSFVMGAFKTFDKTGKLYITGSSSGRSKGKSMLARTITGVPYWDIDLVAVFPDKSFQEIHKWFENTYLKALREAGWTSSDKILFREEPSYILEAGLRDSPDFLFRRSYWADGMDLEIQPPLYQKNSQLPSCVDLSVGQTLEATMTPYYLEKNWYAQLV